jgi:rhodanese-related sulfurtransferase
MTKVTSVIDVRTADEYAAGHLQGAINIDVEGSDFATEVGKLDTAGTYVLYCHSGRRAGIALDQMTGMGFKNVTNLGGLDAAATATGLPIVQ